MVSRVPEGWPSLVVGRFLADLYFSLFYGLCRFRSFRRYAPT